MPLSAPRFGSSGISSKSGDSTTTISLRTYILIGILIVALFALTLLLMGRVPICECGYIKLWHGATMSSENSQHISDWYTFSHIIHGFVFYFVLSLFAPRMSIGGRLLIALSAETSWEIFENTDFIINRYREATISLDYYGDSVINSVSDVVASIFGFVLARRLPVWVIIFLAIVMEVWVGYAIRDNLALNIIMLIHPFDAIKLWQTLPAGG